MKRLCVILVIMAWTILFVTTSLCADSAQKDMAEYLARYARLAATDVPARLSLAGWCREKEMWGQMKDLAQEVLDAEPESRVAYNLLREYDEKVRMPADEEVEKGLREEFKKRFNHDFKTRNTRHFLIVYDTPEAFVSQRSVYMEKAYDSFFYWFNLRKLRPAFLQERLVVVLFARFEDYIAYGKDVDHQDVTWAAGYYSQRTNRSAFYDEATSPQAQKIEKKLQEFRELTREINGKIEQARRAGKNGLASSLITQRNDINQKINQINMQVENQVGLNTTATAIHEVCHMLSYNTGVQKRLVDYPLWVSEGIASSFESPDRFGNRGPGAVHPRNAPRIKEAWKKGQLPPLEEFLFQPPKDKTTELFYAESWTLLHYFYKTNRVGLEKYLASYQQLPIGKKLTEEEKRELFTQAFGEDIKGLEKRLGEYVKDFPGKVER